MKIKEPNHVRFPGGKRALPFGDQDNFRGGPTDSMAPLSFPHEPSAVIHWPWEFLMPGMIIAWFEKDENLNIGHQIVKIDKGSICGGNVERDATKWKIWCKGTNNRRIDSFTVDYHEYIGVVYGNRYDYPYANAMLRYNGQPPSQMKVHPLSKKYFPNKILSTFA